jgi:hypothetical protein
MKKYLIGVASAALFALPAQAASLVDGGTAAFDPTTVNTGTLIASSSFSGQAFTFAATFRSAVYRTAEGTLDFVYQVRHDGAGSLGSNNHVSGFTVAEFTSYLVNALRDGSDHDGAGVFTTPLNNIDGTGFTSLAARSADGAVLTVDFRGNPNQDGSVNDLVEGETSTSYIFRTNARNFKVGTFGVIDGSTLSGLTFAPTGAVPEPATWAMMLGGFGLLGAAARRSSRTKTVLA